MAFPKPEPARRYPAVTRRDRYQRGRRVPAVRGGRPLSTRRCTTESAGAVGIIKLRSSMPQLFMPSPSECSAWLSPEYQTWRSAKPPGSLEMSAKPAPLPPGRRAGGEKQRSWSKDDRGIGQRLGVGADSRLAARGGSESGRGARPGINGSQLENATLFCSTKVGS